MASRHNTTTFDVTARTVRSKAKEMEGCYHIMHMTRQFYSCIVPKVGCSHWLEYIRKQDHIPPPGKNVYQTDPYAVLNFSFVITPVLPSVLGFKAVAHNPSLFKWAVVRHPWKRLVSAYSSKFEGVCQGNVTCFAIHFSVAIPKNVTTLTFHEFVVYLSVQKPLVTLDPHFKPVSIMCQLESIHFDFIGDLDVKEDMDYISNRLGYAHTFTEVGSHGHHHHLSLSLSTKRIF
jgi:hypothetical protein